MNLKTEIVTRPSTVSKRSFEIQEKWKNSLEESKASFCKKDINLQTLNCCGLLEKSRKNKLMFKICSPGSRYDLDLFDFCTSDFCTDSTVSPLSNTTAKTVPW